MAGRGGLNITHSENLDRFIARYGAAAKHIGPPRPRLPAGGAARFLRGTGGSHPSSALATGLSGKLQGLSPLLRAWLSRLTQLGVAIATRHAFLGFAGAGALRLKGPDGAEFIRPADAVVLALGGASWPRLGSEGGWSDMLRKAGVAVTPLASRQQRRADRLEPDLPGDFEGQPIKTVMLRHGDAMARGDVVVTRPGSKAGRSMRSRPGCARRRNDARHRPAPRHEPRLPDAKTLAPAAENSRTRPSCAAPVLRASRSACCASRGRRACRATPRRWPRSSRPRR